MGNLGGTMEIPNGTPPPDKMPIMVELCGLCETAWPAGSLQDAYQADVHAEIKICPDCVEELQCKERKVVDIKKKAERKAVKKKN